MALQARLGATALSSVGSARPVTRARWPFVSGAIVGAGLIGGALLFSSKPAPSVATPAATIAASLVVPAPLVAPTFEPTAVAPVSPSPAPAEPPAPSSRPAPDRLAQEVAFLERATSALHAGRAANALKILDEYQRKFPSGLLGLERGAARAQALCALGRPSEARAELARLPSQSPSVARAKQVCDATGKAPR